jgi:Uncharacterised nucleotidyltransferase
MLLRTLLQIALLPPSADVLGVLRQGLRSATDRQWQEAIAVLTHHRLMPLVFYGVRIHNLTDDIPKPILSQLMLKYLQSLQHNMRLFKSLAVVLERLATVDVYPVVWKGIVLADHLYPDVATRMIGDIDWAITPHEFAVVRPLLLELGFALQPAMATSDAEYFMNADRVLLDVHHRVRLFEGKECLSLTQDLSSSKGLLPLCRVLEPNAMLTHLTVHLGGHSPDMGLPLFWMLDFVFLLRQWGDQIAMQRLNELMPDRQSWRLLGRILRFLQDEFGEPLPAELEEFAQRYKPFTLEGITRQNQLVMWGLHRPQGWVKMAASVVGVRSNPKSEYPEVSHLLRWAAADLWVGDRLSS